DFDDALTLRDDRAYVHIADVSFFVQARTALDRGAAGRAFSTYVPGRVAPMLPQDLSEDLCSLRPHEDRLCVTVEMPLDGGEPSFYRSVIRSRERFTYGRAEAILAGRERADADLTEALKRAEVVSTDLRERRFARGALRVESPEIEFEFDSNGGVASARRAPGAPSPMLGEGLRSLGHGRVGAPPARPGRGGRFRVRARP